MDAPAHAAAWDLAWRIERAEAEQLARTGPPGRAAAREVAGGLVVFKGPRSPFSACIGAGLSGPVDSSDVDAIEAHLAGGPVRVEVAAPAHASLAQELARRAYRLERQLLVWHRSLGEGAPLPRDPGSGATVRPIRGGEEPAWAEVFARAFFGRPPGSAASAAALLAMTSAPGNTCFGAFRGPELVGVGVVSSHGGIATLTGAGVPPEHRGRGLQLALVRGRLSWAAAHGLLDAAAVTEPGTASQRTLERAGFRCVYPKAVLARGLPS
jgi:GNAT superfamily N-acetyltransferase